MKSKSPVWMWSLASFLCALFIALPGAAQEAGEPTGDAASPQAAEEPQSEEPQSGEPQSEEPQSGEGAAQEEPAELQRQGASEVDKTSPRTAEEALQLLSRGVGSTKPKVEPPPAPQPPDGVWLKDDDGREYFLLRLPKSEPWYWANEEKTRIRYQKYRYYEVAEQDEEAFYVRQYRPTEVEPRDALGRTAAEVEAIAASYTPGVGLVDRLTVSDFGEGLPDEGQWRNGFDLADMNGDGHLDIVHAPPRKLSNVPTIFLGDGAGSWKSWGEARFPVIGYAYGDAKVADFNADGHNDVALAMHLNGMALLLGDSEGNFTSWGEGLDNWSPGKGDELSFSSRALRVADWNSDGRPDLVVLGEGPRPARTNAGVPIPDGGSYGIVVYLNQGDGTWQRQDTASTGSTLFGSSLALADFNGDGRLDAATSANSAGLATLVHMRQESGELLPVHIDAVRPNAFVQAATAGDFDGDGRDDLVYSYSNNEDGQWRSGIDLLYSRDGGTWERLPLYLVEARAPIFTLAPGDVDADGRLDLVALDGEGGTFVFTQSEDGWGSEVSPEMPVVEDGCRGYHAIVRDLDGDGSAELVEGFAGEPSALFAPTKCLSRGALRAWKLEPRNDG